MRNIIQRFRDLFRKTTRPTREELDREAERRFLSERVRELAERDQQRKEAYLEMVNEMAEAVRMAGSGPWKTSPKVIEETNRLIASARQNLTTDGVRVREANPLVAQGAYGDIELALQNVEWRREVNLSWLEFSRWGIQQIILIARLYYIKNPIIRRLVNIASAYVFGRGFEVSSPDETANETIKEFFEANKGVLGQKALMKAHRAKMTDGNLFFAFFVDETDTGTVKVRRMDATEIQDVVTDPEDAQKPWYYRRSWTVRQFDELNGQVKTVTEEGWYPAIGYDPPTKPGNFGGKPIHWDARLFHIKCGETGEWLFGCPQIYPALDWAKAARKFLESCLTVRESLAKYAVTITTKGGQQAIEAMKQQLQTSVGPSAPLWDTNPPGPKGATIVSGPGTQIQPFNARGAAVDPEDVRRYLLMCCMVAGVPETFLADVSTGNLATATTLDRPTELVFLEEQEAWREDLVSIVRYVLSVSAGAPNGKIRAAMVKHGIDSFKIIEMHRVQNSDGSWYYRAARVEDLMLVTEAKGKKTTQKTIEVKCTFPTIREGDQQQLMDALVKAATLGNTQGQFVGIDEKAFVQRAYEIVGIENGEELAEDQYPEASYEPDRTIEEPEPEPTPVPAQPSGGELVTAATNLKKAAESLRRRL